LEDTTQAAAPAAATTPADQPPPSAPTPEQATDAPEGQAAAPETDADEDDDAPVDISKPLSKSQLRRLQRQTREREIQAENARLREVVQTLAPPARILSVEERIGKPPNPANYAQNPAAYWAAKATYDVLKQGAESQFAAEKSAAETREMAGYQAIARTYEERQNKARARLPDYDKVVGAVAASMRASGVPISPPLAEAIVTSELAPEIEYHLALNPAKLHALNNMPAGQVAREIGRLEAVLQATPPARTSTQAPPPPSALKGGAAGPVKTLADLAKGEDASDYIAARRAALAKERA
jgi:hypothetical protein